MAWTFGDFQLDAERFQLSRSGQPVLLEPQVLSLLIHLVQNRDSMVTKDQLVAAVWGEEMQYRMRAYPAASARLARQLATMARDRT